MSTVVCLGQLLAVLAGCSSWDEDTPDHLDFALPTVTWSISTREPQWRTGPGTDVAAPGFVCAGPQALSTDCCAPPVDCQKYPFACDPLTNLCALTFDIENAHTVDLLSVPEISAVRGRVLTKVDLLDLDATVTEAAYLPIRSAALYVGPGGLTTSSDPRAVLLTQIDLTSGAVALDASSRQAFSTFGRDYENPFVLLLFAHVVVPNKATPAGDFGLTLVGRARAYY